MKYPGVKLFLIGTHALILHTLLKLMGGQKRLIFLINKFMIDNFKNPVMSGDLSKVYGNSGYVGNL